MPTPIPIHPKLLTCVEAQKFPSLHKMQFDTGGVPTPANFTQLKDVLYFLTHTSNGVHKYRRALNLWLRVYRSTLVPTSDTLPIPSRLLVEACWKWPTNQADVEELLQLQAEHGGIPFPLSEAHFKLACRVMSKSGYKDKKFRKTLYDSTMFSKPQMTRVTTKDSMATHVDNSDEKETL